MAQARANINEFLGHTIHGQYHLLKGIGVGGMGGVYLAERTDGSKERLAVKLLHPDRQQKETLAKRFIREAQISSMIKHPNTIAVYDYGQDPNTGALYLAMEYLDGKTLYRYVRERQHLDLHTASAITQQILASLGNAHQSGIIHRDLKPGNVMIMERPGQPVLVKVLDFGIAKIHDPGAFGGDITKRMTALTQFGEMLGTPHYMPPEQIRGQELSASADLYALGVIFFFMVTGRRPFEDKEGIHVTIAQLTQPFPRLSSLPSAANLPASVQEFLDTTVKKEPKDRFQTAQDMIDALSKIVAALPAPQAAAPVPPPGALRNPAAAQSKPNTPSAKPSPPPPPTGMSMTNLAAIRSLVPGAASAPPRPALNLPSPMKTGAAKPPVLTSLKPPSGPGLNSVAKPANSLRSPAPVAMPKALENQTDDFLDNEQATRADGEFNLNLNDVDANLGESGTVPGISPALELTTEAASGENVLGSDDPLMRTMPDSGGANPFGGRSLPPLPPPPKSTPPPPPKQQQIPADLLSTLPEPMRLPATVRDAVAAKREEFLMGPPTVSDVESPLATEPNLPDMPAETVKTNGASRSAPTSPPDMASPILYPQTIEEPRLPTPMPVAPSGSPTMRWILLIMLFLGLAGAGAASTYFIVRSVRPPAVKNK